VAIVFIERRPVRAKMTDAIPVSREVVVMITSSYPRFPGDTIATFMEPIAQGVAARGHEVHMVLPWHPRLNRQAVEGGVHFHPFRYAPVASLNVFGYSGALDADVRLRRRAYLAAPFAFRAGRQAARRVIAEFGATVVHGHWAVPSGAMAAAAAGDLPVVVSLHGSDIYVAERSAIARLGARRAFARAGWITACSDDLRDRAVALGADRDRSETVPYGVDASRFQPDADARARVRQELGVSDADPVVFTAGRFVHKKGFAYLIEAAARLIARWPGLRVVIGGSGDLSEALRARAHEAGVARHVVFTGVLDHTAVAACLAAADVAVVPSVRDEAGNVDGLPNMVMESLASATPLVATTVGGIPGVVESNRTGILVPPADSAALSDAIDRLLGDGALGRAIGRAAREDAIARHSWTRVAEAFERAYSLARQARVARR
jgi:glycosyltransferase involved in cell wall biosynthesis